MSPGRDPRGVMLAPTAPAGDQRGVMLASTMFALTLLLLLTSTLVLTTFLDGKAAANVTTGREALFAAAAGVEHLWWALRPAPGFERELGWPEGEAPFATPAWFPAPPRTYRVRVAAGPAGSLRATSEGTAAGGARRRVEAFFHREAEMRSGAVLILAEARTDGRFSASVGGELAVDPHDTDGGGFTPLAVATEGRAAATAFGEARAEPRPPVIGATGFDEASDRLRPTADRRLATVPPGSRWGSRQAPEVVVLAGAADIDGDVSAFGMVIADGPIHVHGDFEVEGLLLATAGLVVDGRLVVRGTTWVAGLLDVSGAVRLTHSSGAIGRADATRPGSLPRRAFLGAWRELW